MLNIHDTLTNYASAYQGALTIKKEAEKVAGEKYIGIAYAEEMGKIKDAFQAVIDPLRDTSMKSVQKAIADARKDIQNVVSKPMDADLAHTIDIVSKLPNVTLTEKESVFERCEGNYIATRLCIDALELQGEHLPPKVDEILKDNMKYMKSKLKKYLKENTYAQEQHLKEDLGWSIPKDFVVALFEDAAEQYSCLGCSEPVKRKAKKNTRIIKSKLYVW